MIEPDHIAGKVFAMALGRYSANLYGAAMPVVVGVKLAPATSARAKWLLL